MQLIQFLVKVFVKATTDTYIHLNDNLYDNMYAPKLLA